MEVALYADRDTDEWDAFVAEAPTATFQHTRRFLSYHGSRLSDRSLLIRDPGGKLGAVLPAAVSPDDPASVISHPGATYGGLVFGLQTPPEDVQELLAAGCRFLGDAGFSRLVYKVVPPHLHRDPCQADLYAIWSRGGRLIRRDLWNVIGLGGGRRVSRGRRRTVERARDRGIEIGEDNSPEAYSEFMTLLTERLADRHSTAPPHTLEDLLTLRERFAQQISLWLARDPGGECLAGTWLFDLRPAAVHAQYGIASVEGRRDSALDLLLESSIERAAEGGARCFSFGASTEREGTVLNSGLFSYKSGFGGGSVAHDFYEIELSRTDEPR